MTLSILFLLFGVLFTGASLFLGFEGLTFFKTAVQVEGRVIDLVRNVSRDLDGTSTTYAPLYEFTTVDGDVVAARSEVSSSHPSVSVGDRVELYYDLSNPRKVKRDTFMDRWFMPLLFGYFGIIGVGGGCLGLWKIKKRKEEVAWLRLYGQAVQAAFQQVQLNTSLKVNGQSPWKIYAQWQNPADQQIYVFESENIWFNPEGFLQAGQQITVIIDPQNPQRYVMEMNFLPQG